jgi:hypothetical protein
MVAKGLSRCYASETPTMSAQTAIEQIQRVLRDGLTPEQLAAEYALRERLARPQQRRQGALPLQVPGV